MDECETTYDSLIHRDELPPHNPNAPYTPGGSSSSVRRSYAPSGGYHASSTRIIKPRPQYPSANGTPSAPYSGKKRGRPSKADLERRAQEAATAAEGHDEGGMGLTIGADGAVVAGQKRDREEGEEGGEHDLVSQAQGALAMPAAMMQAGPEGQPPVKRGRGRPRKIRPEEQEMQMQHQQHEQQQHEHQQHAGHEQPQQQAQKHQHTPEQQTPDMIPGQEHDASATPDEMALVDGLQHDAAQHPQHQRAQYAHPEHEHEQSTATLSQEISQDVSQEEDLHAMRVFHGLQAQAQDTGGAGNGHHS